MDETERKTSVIGKREQTGEVRISDEVIAIIADLAIGDVEGIYTYSSRKGKRTYGKGIGIRVEDNNVYANVSIILKKGYKVAAVAPTIQQKIKASIENMLEMNVKEVNVYVVGIQTDKSNPEQDK
ncbi:MAG: Asp23/Gls24 family envelope stress response protein [Firmicutes bacterium]|nr:Asp23/Gls24 family envelope stress response protein [Bacillota bacterium]